MKQAVCLGGKIYWGSRGENIKASDDFCKKDKIVRKRILLYAVGRSDVLGPSHSFLTGIN